MLVFVSIPTRDIGKITSIKTVWVIREQTLLTLDLTLKVQGHAKV